MTRVLAKDDNLVPIHGDLPFVTSKTVSFTGAAGNGAVGFVDLVDVTGTILVQPMFAVTESLASGGAATIAWGDKTSGFMYTGQQAFTDSLAGGFMSSGSYPFMSMSAIVEAISDPALLCLKIEGAAITDGTIQCYFRWRPISSNGNLEAV